LHYTTFRFFKDVGALGIQTQQQWFTEGYELDREEFDRVTSQLSFHDARLVDPNSTSPIVVNFFEKVAVRQDLLKGQAAKWERTAPLAEPFLELRSEDLPPPERRYLWSRFADEVQAAGLYEQGGWA
jgi:hypothetical protein